MGDVYSVVYEMKLSLILYFGVLCGVYFQEVNEFLLWVMEGDVVFVQDMQSFGVNFQWMFIGFVFCMLLFGWIWYYVEDFGMM